MTAGIEVIDRLRRPEYTGENRCVPCTAVNLVIAIGLAVAVGLLAPWPSAPVLGSLVLLVSLGAIYLRGYLVPGTPRFTKTYFPDWLLRRFDKRPTGAWDAEGGDLDVEALLVGAGALAECEDVDDLCLTPDFREAWRERIDGLRGRDASKAALSEILNVPPDRLSVSEYGDAFVARGEDGRARQWESEAAFVADLAAAKELARRAPDWADLDLRGRGQVLNGLRLFIEQCPTCGGPVGVEEEEAVESCCRSFDVVAVACEDCGARLVEAEVPEEA